MYHCINSHATRFVPQPLTQKQAAIVSDCAVAVQIAVKDYSMRHRVLLFDDCVVKFNQSDLLNEGDTQAFIYAALKSSPDAPRVPEVYECFSFDSIQYLVMERVGLPTVEAWINDAPSEAEARYRFDMSCQAIANALRFLFALSPPAGAEIGLIKGAYSQTQSAHIRARSGRARHPFFGADSHAPYRYPDAPALQRHIKKALDKRPRSAPPLAVEISDEPLVMVHGDIKPHNFLIDPKTLRVTLIDFGGISALPRSFVSFTLHATRDKFIAGINKFLGWERSENTSAMAEAAGIYCMTNNRLGLDKDGFPVPKATSRQLPPVNMQTYG
ncbi:hypothetical protein FB451DRAFT_1269911 [Mycena latifolia]|nr:hypothetical protein FB451DRAFT_1269911 [Mycena latifolia]